MRLLVPPDIEPKCHWECSGVLDGLVILGASQQVFDVDMMIINHFEDLKEEGVCWYLYDVLNALGN